MSKRQSYLGISTAHARRMRCLRASENDIKRVKMESAPGNSLGYGSYRLKVLQIVEID